MNLAQQLQEERKKNKALEKRIKELEELNEFLEEASAFFAASRQKVCKKERMKLIALKTENGRITGKISFYCKALDVSKQGFYNYLKYKDKPWKYETLAAMMIEIREEDEYNDTYGRVRMHEALVLKKEEENLETEIPKERTVYRIMERLGISHRPRKRRD